jgi:hypothetical protein
MFLSNPFSGTVSTLCILAAPAFSPESETARMIQIWPGLFPILTVASLF